MEIIASRKETRKPKFVYKGIPEMIDADDRFEWYQREFDRWENGYKERGVELNGFQYYHCTATKMSDEMGAIITPWWRDADELITEGYYRAKDRFYDQLIPKRRGIGLSGLYANTHPERMSKIYPGSTNLLTSADKGRVDSLFQDKFYVGWLNEDPLIQSSQKAISRHGTNVQMDLQPRNFERKSESDPAWRKEVSKILCRQTSDKPADVAAFESQRAVSLLVDEIMLHRRADGVLRSNQATLNRGQRKMFPIVMGGSAGEAETEGLEVCKRLLKNSGKTIEVTFVSGALGINEAPEYDEVTGNPTGRIINFCVNGWSDQEGAMEYILKRRDWLNEHAPEDLMAYIKTYPIAVEEVFQGDNVGHLPQELVPRLEMTYNKVTAEKPPIRTVRVANFGTGDTIVADESGPVRMYEEPVEGVTYGAGCDPIEMVGTKKSGGKEAIKSGTSSALVFGIKNYTTDQLICTYVNDSVFPEAVMNDIISLCNIYKCKMTLERNKGKVLYREFERAGLIDKYLTPQPHVFGTQEVNYSQVLYGYHKGNGTAPLIDNWFLEMLKRSIEKTVYEEVLEQYFKYGTANTDYVSMQEAIEVGYQQWLQDQKLNSSTAWVEHEVVTTELDRNGDLVQVVKTFSTPDPNQKITTEQQRKLAQRMLIAGNNHFNDFQTR